MQKIIAVSVALFSSVSFSMPIIGGEVAQTAPDSGILNLMIRDTVSGRLTLCTGSKISKDVILTAAHCLDQRKLKTLAFDNSVTNPNFKFKLLKVVKTIIHPSYPGKTIEEEAAANDIGLIFVSSEKPQDWTFFQGLRTEAFGFDEVKADSQVEFYGYGCQKPLGYDNSDVTKKVAKANTLPMDLLRDTGGNFRYFFAAQADSIYRAKFITAGRLKDPQAASFCNGDSGGPVFENGKIIGVNSSGIYNDLDPDGNEVSGLFFIHLHSRLSAVQDWLTKNLKR